MLSSVSPSVAFLVSHCHHCNLNVTTFPTRVAARRRERTADDHQNTSPREQTHLAPAAPTPSAPPCPDARPAAGIFTDVRTRYGVTENDVIGPPRELRDDETSGVTVPGEALAPPGYNVTWSTQGPQGFDPSQPPPSYEEVVAALEGSAK